jgi:hypothetical protein
LNPYVTEGTALGSDVVDDMKMIEREAGKKDGQAGWEGKVIRGGFGSSGNLECDLLRENEAISSVICSVITKQPPELPEKEEKKKGVRGYDGGRGVSKKQQQLQGVVAAAAAAARRCLYGMVSRCRCGIMWRTRRTSG